MGYSYTVGVFETTFGCLHAQLFIYHPITYGSINTPDQQKMVVVIVVVHEGQGKS